VALFRSYPPYFPQVIYLGTDRVIHVIIPVGVGFFWAGNPGLPPDPDSGFGDGFVGDSDIDPGGEPDLDVAPSPAGWADFWLINTSEPTPSGPPLAIINNTPDQKAHVIFNRGDLFEAIGNTDAGGVRRKVNRFQITFCGDAEFLLWAQPNAPICAHRIIRPSEKP
jgi:hypothetical protein